MQMQFTMCECGCGGIPKPGNRFLVGHSTKGRTGITGRKARPLAIRFWERVNKSGPIPAHMPDLGACWLWMGVLYRNGYGYISGSKVVPRRSAHRLSWELHHGSIPEGLAVCHHCDNRRCVRPDHLFLGTLAENNADMARKGRAKGGWPDNRGVKNGNAKLTEEQITELRALKLSGLSARTIADYFGVTTWTIYDVSRGRSWKHVTAGQHDKPLGRNP